MCEFGFEWTFSCEEKKRTRGKGGMGKYTMITLALIATMVFGQTVYDSPGPHTLWDGDSLQQADTLISNPLHTGHFPYLGVWIKTTNPADSTQYRIFFRGAFAKTDTFAISSDTAGAEVGSTIMRIADTLWHYCSVILPVATYTKIYLIADDTDHGNRACVWLKIFLWRPDYWEDYKIID